MDKTLSEATTTELVREIIRRREFTLCESIEGDASVFIVDKGIRISSPAIALWFEGISRAEAYKGGEFDEASSDSIPAL